MVYSQFTAELDDADLFDLTCPGCNADLLADPAYESHRICSTCNRHFWISARERVALLQEIGSVVELDYAKPDIDPIDQHEHLGPADRVRESRERSGLDDAVVTATLDLNGGGSAVVAILDPVLLAEGLGIVATDKLIRAFYRSVTLGRPMLVFCAGGSRPPSNGLIGDAQSLRLDAAISRLQLHHIPVVAVISNGVGGNILETIVAQASVRVIEPDVLLPGDLHPDLIRSRIDQSAALVDLLNLKEKVVQIALDHPVPGVTIRAIGRVGACAMTIDIDSDAWDATTISFMHRACSTATVLDAPIVMSLTGRRQLPASESAAFRQLLRSQQTPMVIRLHGDIARSHITLLAADLVTGDADLRVFGPRPEPFGQADLLRTGIIDKESPATTIEEQELRLLERQSPARRIDRRMRTMDRRGADPGSVAMEATIEMITLGEINENIRRSFDDWRNKIEQRDFHLPRGQKWPEFRGFKTPAFARPDLTELRERWLSRMRETKATDEGIEPSEWNEENT